MLPWFSKWNREHPANVDGPAILVGVVGTAVAVGVAIIVVGNPWQTTTEQTGPRGIGMGVTKSRAAADAVDPTLALYTSAAPLADATVTPPAGVVYPFAGPLANLPVAEYERLVKQMREWTGIPDLMETDNYQTQVAWAMINMTRDLNENWSGHVNVSDEAGVNCFTCHRGQTVPSDIWYRIDPMADLAQGWGAVQNYATAMTVSTALPQDALQRFLVDGQVIKVHDLEANVVNQPGEPLTRDAERTYSLMNYVSNSMGVNCTFCHNTRAFYDAAQVTPQWSTALLGYEMLNSINNSYLLPLQTMLPPERLGPKHGDAPKVACGTCHKGDSIPMKGINMISDWPELASAAPAQ